MTALSARQADLSRARPPRWAWQDRVVIGYLNLLLGNEDIGKGTFVAWLIARLTRGEMPGDLRGVPARVGIVGDEDSYDDVWAPRLHAAGADLPSVVQLERPDGDLIDLHEDRDGLLDIVRGEELRLVFFDQLLDNLPLGVNDWGQKPVRDALRPLRLIARELDIATLCSLHPNKRANSFRELVAGSSAFNALSRSSLLLGEHPEDSERRVLVRGKGNLSKTPAGVEFAIVSRVFEAHRRFDVPAVTDVKVGAITVDDLIEPPSTRSNAPSKVRDACEIVEALVPRDGKWHPAKPIFEACAAEGMDEQVVKRARKRLALEFHRGDAFPAPVLWRWPDTENTTEITVGSPDFSDPTVLSVPSSSSENTENTKNGRPQCDLSAFDDEEDARWREIDSALLNPYADALAAPKCGCDSAIVDEDGDCTLCGRSAR